MSHWRQIKEAWAVDWDNRMAKNVLLPIAFDLPPLLEGKVKQNEIMITSP